MENGKWKMLLTIRYFPFSIFHFPLFKLDFAIAIN